MEKIQVNTGTPTRPAPIWRHRLPGTGVPLILLGLLGLTFLTGALALAASQNLPLEKGNNPMQQALKASVTDMPPLDKTQPGRVETFTFGLG